jgi:hypothetical protein
MELRWVVDGLAEADPRLRALEPPPRNIRETETEGAGRHETAAHAA